jgi:hypothetical protein
LEVIAPAKIKPTQLSMLRTFCGTKGYFPEKQSDEREKIASSEIKNWPFQAGNGSGLLRFFRRGDRTLVPNLTETTQSDSRLFATRALIG